jgi:phosphoserine phosphatase RsbU/P
MRILIADDSPVSCRLLEGTLKRWGHDVLVASDGLQAWEFLLRVDSPLLAVLDWVMPGLNGTDLCRRVHDKDLQPRPYLILLTANRGKENLLAGFASGADDYIVKPFDVDELRARINVGARVLSLQAGLAQRVRQLESALTQIKHLQGLLPLCTCCKKPRLDPAYWRHVESYVARHADARFGHGLCPDCYHDVVQPALAQPLPGGPAPAFFAAGPKADP